MCVTGCVRIRNRVERLEAKHKTKESGLWNSYKVERRTPSFRIENLFFSLLISIFTTYALFIWPHFSSIPSPSSSFLSFCPRLQPESSVRSSRRKDWRVIRPWPRRTLSCEYLRPQHVEAKEEVTNHVRGQRQGIYFHFFFRWQQVPFDAHRRPRLHTHCLVVGETSAYSFQEALRR